MAKVNFSDVIKSSYLSEVQVLSMNRLITTLLLAFLLGLFIVVIYRLSYQGVLFSWNFALSLLLLTLVTAAVILTVSSNVILSLGMVGALSIVRFRTAVKDAVDTVFMFWAIACGIMLGAGYITVSLAAAGIIGVLFLLAAFLRGFLTSRAYMLILRYDPEAETEVKEALGQLGHYSIRSESLSGDKVELVAETRLQKKNYQRCRNLRNIDGVYKVDIVGYNGDTLL